MNLEFALIVFCLTLVALVAIVYGKDNLAGKALDILKGLIIRFPSLKIHQATNFLKQSEGVVTITQSDKTLQ